MVQVLKETRGAWFADAQVAVDLLEKIYEFLKKENLPEEAIHKMLRQFERRSEYGELFSPRVQKANVKKYLDNIGKAFREVLDELKKLPTVEERRRYVLENMQLGYTGKTDLIVWDLPALITCPGASRLCYEYCYAMKGNYLASKHKQRRMVFNLLASLLPEFSDEATKRIARDAPKAGNIVRLHGSGNMYTTSYLKHWLEKLGINPRELKELLGVDLDRLPEDWYIRQWSKVVEKLDNIQFYTYTRTWRLEPVFESMKQHLLSKPNFTLYLSVDATMPESEISEAERLREAHPDTLKIAWTGMLPRKGRAVLCRYEWAKIAGKTPITCRKCRICIYGRSDVVFPIHA